MNSNIRTESPSDEVIVDHCSLPTSKTRDSLIERCKQSGLALRRYLYCMEPSATESSEDEDDYYKCESPDNGVCSVSNLKSDEVCRARLCGKSTKPSSFLKSLNEKGHLFHESDSDLEERQKLLFNEGSKSDKDDSSPTCTPQLSLCSGGFCRHPSAMPPKLKNSLHRDDEDDYLDGTGESLDENDICAFHNYLPEIDRDVDCGNINCDIESFNKHAVLDEKQLEFNEKNSKLSLMKKPRCKKKFKLNFISTGSEIDVPPLQEETTIIASAKGSKCNVLSNDSIEKLSSTENENVYRFPNYMARRATCNSRRSFDNFCDPSGQGNEAYGLTCSLDPRSPMLQKSYLSLDRTYDLNPTSDNNYSSMDSACDLDVNFDVNQLETLLECSPSGFMSSLARVNLGVDDPDDDNHPVGIEESDGNHSGPVYNHALPYLSDRLRTNLVHRLGLSDFVGDSNGDDQGQGNEDEINQASAMAQAGESAHGRQLNDNTEFLSDDRTLSDLLFDLHKIDMIDRVFLTETGERLQNQKNHHSCSRQEGDNDLDSGDDGNDEFDCECQYCIESRLGQSSTGCNGNDINTAEDEEQQDTNRNGNDNALLDSWLMDDDSSFAISSVRLPPLDMLIQERRADLERMFETVIMQMLAVYPDLLTDQAPPPASPATIDELIIAPPTSQQIGQKLSCPICLSLYEASDSTTVLPCQHLFHPLCIQAWLSKSGTCPVCRFVLE